jgi:hypothetical protein
MLVISMLLFQSQATWSDFTNHEVVKTPFASLLGDPLSLTEQLASVEFLLDAAINCTELDRNDSAPSILLMRAPLFGGVISHSSLGN